MEVPEELHASTFQLSTPSPHETRYAAATNTLPCEHDESCAGIDIPCVSHVGQVVSETESTSG